ncbi:kinesin light chain 1-like [Uloborus diversus]|uniref:kinesin light chain 1-like n=1 Tax=Uloborus diversus TaxID=327109 RepID=UPI0024099C61|nr:kinesin light chain 1-like [Uloborus diversus]
MFTGAKMRLLKWRGKKNHVWKPEIPQPFMERNKIILETQRILSFLESLKEEYTKILDQLLEQIRALSESGEEKNSLIEEKVEFLRKDLKIIERGLDDAQIFLTLNNIVENIESEVKESEKAIQSLKDDIRNLKSENNSLRNDLSIAQRKLVESEEQEAVLEVERDHQVFLNSLESELSSSPEESEDEESLDLSFIDDNEMDEVSVFFLTGLFPNLPYIAEIDLSLNPRLKIFYNLVMGYIIKGSYEIAAPLCKTTLQDLREKCSADHPDVIAMMDIITMVYRGMRHYKDAASIQEEILEVKRKSMKEDNISIAFTLNNLAALYGKIGKIEEAEKFCRSAIDCRKKILGTDHPDVAKQLCNLAAICSHTKKFMEALKCYREALEIFSKTLDPNNFYIIKTKSNIASLLLETENYHEAESLYKEILKCANMKTPEKQENDRSLYRIGHNSEIVLHMVDVRVCEYAACQF